MFKPFFNGTFLVSLIAPSFVIGANTDYEVLSSKVRRLEEKSAALEARLSGEHPELSRFRGAQAIYNGGLVIAEDKSYTITIGGYARLDMLYTPDQIGDLEAFTTATIPVEGADGIKTINGEDYVRAKDQVHFNGKQSRLNLLAEMPLEKGKFVAFIEGDFWGAGDFRLRHAFGKFSEIDFLGGKAAVTLGQTDSSFAIPDSQANTIDNQGPNANFGERYALVQFHHQINDWFSYQLGLEKNQYDVSQGQVDVNDVKITVNEYDSNYPMIVAAMMFGNNEHNIQFSAAYSSIEGDFDIDSNTLIAHDHSKVDGYAFNLGGVVSVLPDTHIRYYGVYSKGLGLVIPDLVSGYAEGNSGLNAEKTHISAIESYGFSLNLEQIFTERWSANLIWSTVDVNNSAGQADYAFKTADYWAANVIFTPTKQFMFGLEYLFGKRENKSGFDGDASRAQFAAQFNF